MEQIQRPIKTCSYISHIAKSDLIKFVETVKPKQIIPIHTLANGKFKEYFGDKVIELNKEKVLEL